MSGTWALCGAFAHCPYLGHLTGGYMASPSATPKFRKAKLHISPERYMKWRIKTE